MSLSIRASLASTYNAFGDFSLLENFWACFLGPAKSGFGFCFSNEVMISRLRERQR